MVQIVPYNSTVPYACYVSRKGPSDLRRKEVAANRVLKKVPRELLDSQVNDIHLALIARNLKWEELVPLLGPGGAGHV